MRSVANIVEDVMASSRVVGVFRMSATAGHQFHFWWGRPRRNPRGFSRTASWPRRSVMGGTIALSILGLGLPIQAAPFVRVAGGVFTISIDAEGEYAYLINDSLLAVLDVRSRRLVRQHSTVGVSDGGPLDASGTLLPVFDFQSAGVIDVRTGEQRNLITNIRNGAYYGATVANGALYAASFNGRVVYAVPLTGGAVTAIDPYAEASELSGGVAGPCEVVTSPDGSTILMGDRNNRAIHAIRTSDNSVAATYVVGFEPCRLFFKDAQTAVAVNAGHGIWRDSPEDYVVVDLQDPGGPLRPRHMRGLKRLSAAAMGPAGRFLALLDRGEAPRDANDELLVPTRAARVGVVNLKTGRVRARRRVPKARGLGYAVAITPDARWLLVGTTKGVQFLRLRRR